MTALNPGDRVRVTRVLSGDESTHLGAVGTLVELDPRGRPVVRHEGHSDGGCIVEGAELESKLRLGNSVRVVECVYEGDAHERRIGKLIEICPTYYRVQFAHGGCDARVVELVDTLRTPDDGTDCQDVTDCAVSEDIAPPSGPRVVVGPEMREVARVNRKFGDTVALTGTLGKYRASPVGPMQPGDAIVTDSDGVELYLYQTTLIVTRPISPLPDKPGAVLDATVRGINGIRVVLSPDYGSPDEPWFSVHAANGLHWHADSDITEFVGRLEGEDGHDYRAANPNGRTGQEAN